MFLYKIKVLEIAKPPNIHKSEKKELSEDLKPQKAMNRAST